MRLIGLLAALTLTEVLSAGVADNPLKIELISEAKSIAAGKTFSLGLHLLHPPGSHSYWRNPGIVGLATQVEWEMPPGFHAADIQWPAPQIVKMASYEAQGYEGETLLIIPITPPNNLSASTATITAKVSWMCCGKTCEPAVKIPFSITLPVSDAASTDPSTAPLFQKFRALIPRNDPSWKATVRRQAGKIILTLKSPGMVSHPSAMHFFTADGQVDSNQNQQLEILSNDAVRIILIPSETTPEHSVSLPGVVSFSTGDSKTYIEVNPPYERGSGL